MIKLLGNFLPPRSKNLGKADLLWNSDLPSKPPGLEYILGAESPRNLRASGQAQWGMVGAKREPERVRADERQEVGSVGGRHIRQKMWVLEHVWG